MPRQSDDEFGTLTDAFNRMAQRVRDMVRARDRLLLDVSHELRSPLTRMKVALAMLPDDPRKEAMAADVAEMETLVSTLLELERLREGPGIRTGRHDLIAILREEVERHREHPPGYGLGLGICKRIMEAHGGGIAVERHAGRGGVTFVLRFPRAAGGSIVSGL